MDRVVAFRRLDMALALLDQGDFEAAAEVAEAAVAAAPREAELHFVLGQALEKSSQCNQACDAYRQALALQEEDRLGAAVRLSLLGGQPLPERLPPAYVEALFNEYAPRFEESLLGNLAYSAPERLREILITHLALLPPKPEVLDLGCGTGLAGLAIRDLAAWLEGIDLSQRMLEQAAAKGIYDALRKENLESPLPDEPRRFDLIIAADVLNYLGDLTTAFSRIAAQLRPGGMLAFSIESAGDSKEVAYDLGPGQRFRHDSTALRAWLLGAGFEVVEQRNAALRTEKRHPVDGQIILAKRMVATDLIFAPAIATEVESADHAPLGDLGSFLN